jgi:polyhydroxyalkanoate synthesis regulator phasin
MKIPVKIYEEIEYSNYVQIGCGSAKELEARGYEIVDDIVYKTEVI